MVRMLFYSILIGAVVVASLVVENADAGYQAINDYLVEKVDSKNVLINMEAAVEWLKLLESTKTSKVLSYIIVKDLRKFTALQQVIKDTKCDQSNLKIMLENELEKINPEKSVRRIDVIMDQIFIEHSKKCSEVYPGVFVTRKGQFGEAFKYVKNIGDRLMEADKGAAEGRDLGDDFYNLYDLDNIFNRFKNTYSVTGFDHSEPLYDALRANANGNIDARYLKKQVDERSGKMVVAKDKIKQLAKELLFKPCDDYVNLFGPDLFIPARFDAKYYVTKHDDKLPSYYGAAYFTICELIVEKESVIIDDIIRYIGRS